MKVLFSPPYIDQDVITEVVDTLTSGWITTGPKVKALEEAFANYVGVTHAVAVNSWTSGAIMVLRWLGLKPGDEVIVPAYTYCATALAVLEAGGTPVMVDIDSDLTISTEAISKAITPRTKAIIPVDIGGWACDYEAIQHYINEEWAKAVFTPTSPVQRLLGRIMLIADAAHSLGATQEGQRVGSLCDITIFSLHAVKNITSAEGGMICLNLPEPFNNDELYKHFRIMTIYGQSKDALAKTKPGSWEYDILFQGMKINMPDVNAAIALAQLRKYDSLLAERRRIYVRYNMLLQPYEWALPPPFDNEVQTSAYHLYPLRIRDITLQQRNKIIAEIATHDVAVNVHFIPMPMLTVFMHLGYKIRNYPESYDNYSREISLPVYPQLTNDQIDFVVATVVEAYNKIIHKWYPQPIMNII
jgi:Predicted pyridoxal phosphate-dependent enzyme apparently involved in regulation of cell wall biogenesis